jgi:hypothetical protein
LPDNLSISQVTSEAFNILGERGIIRSTNQHGCSGCVHAHRTTADLITADDPAAVVGVDENRVVPDLADDAEGQGPAPAIDDLMEVDDDDDHHHHHHHHAPVRMVVMDGIVMGHQVSGNVDNQVDGL